jgi:hypothetical protein
LRRWFKITGKRDDIFLATKFGITVSPAREFNVCSDPEYVKQACEKSLKRLGVKCVDLYYCHRVDKVTPIERTVQAMAELKGCALPLHIPNIPCDTDFIIQRRENQIPGSVRSQCQYLATCPCHPSHHCCPNGIFTFFTRY